MSQLESESDSELELELEYELNSEVDAELELEELELEYAAVDGAYSRSSKRLRGLTYVETHSGHNQQPLGGVGHNSCQPTMVHYAPCQMIISFP